LQIPWVPGVSLNKYAKDRDSVIFPIISKCPICRAKIKLYRHGYYSRNVITPKQEYRIDICRYFCRSCQWKSHKGNRSVGRFFGKSHDHKWSLYEPHPIQLYGIFIV